MNYSSDFSNRLKEERKRLGLTQAEIAEKCGVSARMWVKYEQGLSMPGGEIFMTLSRLGVNVAYLFTESFLRTKDETTLPVSITTEEFGLLVLYRQATENNKKIIMTLAEMVDKKEE